MVAKLFGYNCVEQLQHMKAHEVEHFAVFDKLASDRKSRTCKALWLWSAGGYLLGFVTALFGTKGIWTCTIAVERNVFNHLENQLAWAEQNDVELHHSVQKIINDEAEHRDQAINLRGQVRYIDRILEKIVAASTNFAIWLSHKL